MKKFNLLLVLCLAAMPLFVNAQHFDVKKDSVVYKEVDGHELNMIIYKPDWHSNMNMPAIVFFFGGGWVGGDPSHFQYQAKYLASRGIMVFCPDYRTKSRHGTTPFESVKDARSAMRYLKTNAGKLGIDTSRIVVSGGSAGGHLAACIAVIDNVNEATDNLSVSTRPLAMILFNPVVDTGKLGYGQEKLDGREFDVSPVHHVVPGIPPVLIFHGTNDKTVPYENVVRFKQAMDQVGNKCVLVGYRKQEHGFFNYNRSHRYFKKTLLKTEIYLEELNLLRGKSWLNKYVKSL